MVVVVVDNTGNLDEAYMTPKLLECIRESGVDVRVVATDVEVAELFCSGVEITGLILSGGPLCLSSPVMLTDISVNINLLLRLAGRVPVLGICFGFQLLAHIYGGSIRRLARSRKGVETVGWVDSAAIFRDFAGQHRVFSCHADALDRVPDGFRVVARGGDGTVQAVENLELKVWGVQFHPEGLPETRVLIKRFLEL